MYLHLGQDTVIREQTIVGIFDMENTTISKHTRRLLKRAEQEHRVQTVSYELPKSFVVCADGNGDTVYLSQLAPATLTHRLKA